MQEFVLRPKLPSGHQELSYLQSSGTQFIRLTNIKPDNTTRVEAKFYNNTTGSWYIFGSREVGGTNYFTQSGSATNSTITYWVNGATGSSIGWSRSSTGATYEVILETKNGVFDYSIKDITNNRTFTQSNVPYTALISTVPDLYIFATNSSNIIGGTTRFYYFRIYNGGVLTHNLVPDKYNNQVGMYDTVSGTFYGNSGSGSFTAGQEITTFTPISCRVAMVRRSSNLLNKKTVPNTNMYIVYSSGQPSSPSATGGTWRYSDYIEVEPSAYYYFNEINATASTAGSAWYTASKTYISGFNATTLTNNGNKMQAPANAKYLRHSFRIDNGYNVDWENTVMVSKGQSAVPYEPYLIIKPVYNTISAQLKWVEPVKTNSNLRFTSIYKTAKSDSNMEII